MLFFVIFVYLASWVQAQNGRGPQNFDHNGHGWDIRLAVPGNPGNDYPTLGTIPRTSFSCAGREPGYYADIETNCQVFRVCTVGSTYGFQSFLCPNGTLFNQAVFVCDWWMNVNCQNSENLFTYNNDQFENLRLGPQLMKDIKKMLTHPMQNPYDKAAMKANVIVMQDYKPPAGQLFPNEALIAGPERAPNNVYVPKQNLIQNVYNNENTYSGSTVDPKYVPTAFTTIRPTTYRDNEFFQRQIQYDQSNRLQSTPSTPSAAIISNGHTGQFAQYQNSGFTNSNTQLQRPIQNNNVRNAQYTQRQSSNIGNTQTSNTQSFQRGQFNRQPQNDNRKASYINSIRQQSSISFPKQQQFINTQNKFNQLSKSTPSQNNTLELADEAHKEVKQDVVSNLNAVPSTIVTKIVPFSRIIQEPKTNKAKPRITVKTWIVKPTKAAKLIASPTAYTYNKPTQPPNNNLIDYTTPYTYDPPGTQSPTEIIISEVDNVTSYFYNNPAVTTAETITVNNEVKQFDVSPTPSNVQRLLPTVSGKLDEEPSSAPPTEASRFYLSPSTRQPTGRLYLPPSEPIPSRQYLSPIVKQPVYSTSAQLRATSTTPSPAKISPNKLSNIPSLQPTRPSPANSNRSLPFTDILTKDKIDITVNDIVTDTQDMLKTASPPQFGRYRSEIRAIDYPEDNFVPTESVTDSGESLTSQIPAATQSSRVSSYPSRKLEPPNISYSEFNSNRISNLPYFKESLLPPANTIERTVTLRITIPEKLAAYLFRGNNQSDYNKLEIMNTGSSNYLVLSNSFATPSPNFIPLGRLVDNKNSGIFDSQALVFSLLADSINAAKEYSNYAQREVQTSTPATPISQYRSNQDVTQISNQISQLTASQFENNNFNRNPNIITPSTPLIQENQIRSNSVYANNQLNQVPQIPSQLNNAQLAQIKRNYYSTQFKPNTNTMSSNLLANDNQIYSGQLYQFPVPDVTNQIYNRPFTGNLVQPNNIQTTNLQPSNTLQLANINSNAELRNQAPTTVQIVPSQTLPFNSAKLQAEQPTQPKPFNQDRITNLLNSDNGISAQLRDRIIGTIPHPSEDNKLVTYEKDQSYYFTTNLNDKQSSDIRSNAITANNIVTQSSNNANGKFPDLLTFQFIPSVSYELEDKKEQQEILDAFQIDEFGAPRDVNSNLIQNIDQGRNVPTTNVGQSANQVVSSKQIDDSNNNISPLYNGLSSYLAPQSSVGNLRSQSETVQNNLNSRLEDLDEDSDNGYPKTRPTREFTF